MLQLGDDALAGLEAVEAGVGAGGGGHRASSPMTDHRQVVALRLEIVGVVRGGDLHGAGAESGSTRSSAMIGISRSINGSGRSCRAGRVARVVRVDGDGGIAEHRLRARGRDASSGRAAVDGIADVQRLPCVSS